MNRLSTMAKAIGMIALVALLIAVPIEIVTAQIPDNPADSLERPAEVIELAPVEIVRAEMPDNPADRLEWPAEVVKLAPGETCPDTSIRVLTVLTPEEMELLQGDIDIQVSMPISGELPPGVWRAPGGWMFRPGGTMVISVTWTPAASVVGLGARCADTGDLHLRWFIGGFAGVVVEFPYGGLFQAIVYNWGPYTISYSGIVDVGGIRQVVRVELAFGETCPVTGIRALTPEEVQLLRRNRPNGRPWIGIERPGGRGPILFSSCEHGYPTTAEMLEAGRIIIGVYTPDNYRRVYIPREIRAER